MNASEVLKYATTCHGSGQSLVSKPRSPTARFHNDVTTTRGEYMHVIASSY